MITLILPKRLTLDNAIDFCNKLWDVEDSDTYEFDFQFIRFTEPFTMLYVANELKRFSFLKKESKSKCQASNYKHLSYQSHMGFFKAFGLNHGNEPGKATGSSTYLPLTILDIEEIKQEASDKYLHIGDLLELKAENMAQLLTQQGDGDLVDTLTFSIREIMRNVVEHSNSKIIEYCAQYWPSKDQVELAIMDTGDGIMKGLSSNPFLHIESERDALHLALMPGVSGKMYKGVKKRKNDPWQNSGFGLYMTSRICRNGGDFLIISNNSGLLLNDEKIDKKCTYKGTALRLRMDTSKITTYSSMLEKYRNEGSDISKEFGSQSMVEPSIASTMLARDFNQKIE